MDPDRPSSPEPLARGGDSGLGRMRALLDRPLSREEIEETTAVVAAKPERLATRFRSVLVFRVGAERLALEADATHRVVPVTPVRRVPHRTNAVFAGIANVSGELTPVVPNALPIKADLAKKLALGPFKGVAGEVVAVLARRAQPWFAPPAHRLPPGVHLILAGELDQQVGAPGTMATVTLGNGDAIGILAAVDGGPEPHVRVLENVTCARFEPAVAAALIEADDRVGSAFRSALLTALGNQTAYANARLTDLLRRRSG